jgi:hypothetical protein
LNQGCIIIASIIIWFFLLHSLELNLDDASFCIILQSLFCSLVFCIDRNYICQIYEFMNGKKLNARFTWI